MNPNPHLPESWPSFEDHLKPDVRDESYQSVFDFQARYRFAKSFQGVNVEGYSPSGSTVDDYSALLKIFFVYAAMEQLCKVLKKQPVAVSIISPTVAKRVRKELYGNGNTRFAESLRKCETNGSRKSLEAFWNGTSDDIRPILTTLRNGFAHGDFTPAGLALRSTGRREILLDLADTVLAYMNESFTEWVVEEIARRDSHRVVEPSEDVNR
ncbi:hypothetical protein [Arthrobacter bambusae]|uniref:MAE-28990/MAE-18760-like HEPN domain-containing protein n=1 Tax=Arthrobacter bambusae TaxID=1338426 RepID=A0AAW8DAD4_9MICC|nr:hypothetical protein [Arthrobacter bambusae]MDP9903255.1 hypothetical protein [Arthrobacter bambusae]MDQ0128751.1 hypothetical protein [Arthrobacter bambusae]MDQ0180092.1 hypothetical protein [Arthrobacter bambusae]